MPLLPAFNARLLPCSESWAAMTPAAQGRHCARCQRVVQDFSRSLSPAADLAAARAAAPDGRVCGRFAWAQVQGPQPLTQRLRWFLVALVLVVGQGLSARAALAQVRQGVQGQPITKAKKQISLPEGVYGMVAEQMPSFRGGGNTQMVAYIQHNVNYPSDSPEGRLFARFTIDAKGHVRNPAIVKGLTPGADAEVVRVIKAMDGFIPGTRNGLPVDVSLTVPITFKKQ